MPNFGESGGLYNAKMKTVLITGGTGLIGQAITQALLEKGFGVVVLTRRLPKAMPASGNLAYALWDIPNQKVDVDAVCSADYIIHLAGAGIGERRWTSRRKQELVSSRTDSGALLVRILNENPHRLKAFISASAIGWYGADSMIPNPRPFTESDPAARGFLGDTCRQWEESLEPLHALGVRLVRLRTGLVLSPHGGLVEAYSKPLSWGIAPVIGNGRQVVSWIHMADLVRLYITAMLGENWAGNFNAVAPNPVSQRELIITLARYKRGRWFLPIYVPPVLLKIVLGQMSEEVLKSATISSGKVEGQGFIFQYPYIKGAVEGL